VQENPIGAVGNLVDLLVHVVAGKPLNEKHEDYQDKGEAHIKLTPLFRPGVGIFDEGRDDREHGRY